MLSDDDDAVPAVIFVKGLGHPSYEMLGFANASSTGRPVLLKIVCLELHDRTNKEVSDRASSTALSVPSHGIG